MSYTFFLNQNQYLTIIKWLGFTAQKLDGFLR